MAKRGKDSLGDRMKEFYENRAKTKLTRRMPVIIRLDGRAFHTFTKGFAKPQETDRNYARGYNGNLQKHSRLRIRLYTIR